MIQLLPDFLNEIKPVLNGDFQKFLEIYNAEPYRGLRANTLKISVEKLKTLLDFQWNQVPFALEGTYVPSETVSLGSSPLHHCGAYYVQEPSAMSAVTLLDPRMGETVLDLCAAPGGKSTQTAAKLNGKGLLWSNEIVKSRASVLLSNIERMGVRNAVVSSESPETLCGKLLGCFDKILVDAPCSGEGMFRKEPQALEHWSREHVLACAARQLNILESAKLALKPGGVIVYSTCTFSQEENEGVIEKFLKNNPDFEIEDGNEQFGLKTIGGAVRIFPFHGGEGHFAVRLRHKCILNEMRTFPSSLSESGGVKDRKNSHKKQTKKFPVKPMEKELSKEEILDFYDSIFINRPFGEDIHQVNSKIVLLPEALKSFPSIEKCGVLRAGVLLGEIRKGRIEPAHSAFMAAKKEECISAADFTLKGEDIIKYLKGEEIKVPQSFKGFTAVCCEGMTAGFGKAVDGTLKNKYPKGLRLL